MAHKLHTIHVKIDGKTNTERRFRTESQARTMAAKGTCNGILYANGTYTLFYKCSTGTVRQMSWRWVPD